MERDAQLVEAVQAGDLQAARRALHEGANPDTSESSRKMPVLVMAAQNGSAEIVGLLLDAGAAPNVASGWEWTPLRAATYEGHAQVVSLLLERGADPNSGRRRGSILHQAVGIGRSHGPASCAILEALLRAGAKVMPAEEPAIVGAVEHRAVPSMLRLLLANGESANQRRRDGAPVLTIAARRDDAAAVDTLLAGGANVDAADAAGCTALMHAVERGHEAVTRVLLAHGADADARAPDGTTAILLAQAWHRSRMQFLLGARSVGAEAVHAARSIMELKATVYELRGDRSVFDVWARIIDHTISELGDDEFQTLVSEVAVARRFADRLRREPSVSSAVATWHSLQANAAEVDVVRGCLLNLAYGPGMGMPQWLTTTAVVDMFEELAHQLDR